MRAETRNAWGACDGNADICGTYAGNANANGFVWNQLTLVKDALNHDDLVAEGCPRRAVLLEPLCWLMGLFGTLLTGKSMPNFIPAWSNASVSLLPSKQTFAAH